MPAAHADVARPEVLRVSARSTVLPGETEADAMGFQSDPERVIWRLNLAAPPPRVYEALATDAGRAGFWAESAVEDGGSIRFVFPNGQAWDSRILEAIHDRRFTLRYLGDTTVAFALADDGNGGTELILEERGVAPADRVEAIAGWVSVLMSLKARVDFGVDLRGHDTGRSWDAGYAEN